MNWHGFNPIKADKQKGVTSWVKILLGERFRGGRLSLKWVHWRFHISFIKEIYSQCEYMRAVGEEYLRSLNGISRSE